MYKSVALVSLLMFVASCTEGEDGQMMMETPPSDTMDETPPSPPPSPPPPPTPPETNAAPVITTETITGQEGVPLDARLRATDADGDTISFALIDGPKWLSVGPSGIVSGTPGGTDIGDAPITVAASDGTNRVEAEIDLDIAYDPIEQALRTGDYTFITDETELTPPQALLEDFDRIRA